MGRDERRGSATGLIQVAYSFVNYNGEKRIAAFPHFYIF